MRSILFALSAILSFAARAQQPGTPVPKEPVKWAITAQQQEPGAWDIVFTATVDQGWYVYSQENFGEAGPMPTAFAFDTLPNFTLNGTTAETGDHKKEGMDPVFEMKVKKYAGHAIFTQRINTSEPVKPVTGRFDFMTCNDEACIFPDPVYFSITPATGAAAMTGVPFPKESAATGPANGILDPVEWSVTASDKGNGKWQLDFQATVNDGWSVYSQKAFGEGPIPTSIVFDTLATAKPIGEPTEAGPDMHEGMDDMFGIVVRKYKHEATFSRMVLVTDPAEPISGAINFMACDNSKCVFPDPVKFSIIPATGAAMIGDEPIASVLGGGGCDLKLAKVNLDEPVLRGDVETVDNQVRSGGSLWNIFFLGFIG